VPLQCSAELGPSFAPSRSPPVTAAILAHCPLSSSPRVVSLSYVRPLILAFGLFLIWLPRSLSPVSFREPAKAYSFSRFPPVGGSRFFFFFDRPVTVFIPSWRPPLQLGPYAQKDIPRRILPRHCSRPQWYSGNPAPQAPFPSSFTRVSSVSQMSTVHRAGYAVCADGSDPSLPGELDCRTFAEEDDLHRHPTDPTPLGFDIRGPPLPESGTDALSPQASESFPLPGQATR